MNTEPRPSAETNSYQLMSLRDYFAAKVLQGAMTNLATSDPDVLAEQCYMIADAMLVARSKIPTP